VMASPLSKGLMAKAIGESGGALYSAGLGYESREVRERRDSEFATKAFGTAKIAELRRVPTEDVVRAATAKGAVRFGPDVDGYFLPESVPALYAAGKQAHIPVLAGWNLNEALDRTTPALNVATFEEKAQKEFGGRAKDFLAVYPGTTDAAVKESANDIAADRFIAYSTWRWIEAQVQTGKAPVYRYHFTLASPGDKNHSVSSGAFHSDDIEYVFGTLDSRPEAPWRPEDRKLSDQMGSYWTNFAKTGDPNGAGLPKWPAYAPTEWQVMQLDAAPKAGPDTLRARYLFLDSVWAK
jgi:para-nitrobenzyl esterase